ncbi:MAG: hypothetical protein IT288_06370 [Bdellovibrionales bacterium]|nr:hypothetical protein [Bdellovibrionales bacterium]
MLKIRFFIALALVTSVIMGWASQAQEADTALPYAEEPLGAQEEERAGRINVECGECARRFTNGNAYITDNPSRVADRVSRVLAGQGSVDAQQGSGTAK